MTTAFLLLLTLITFIVIARAQGSARLFGKLLLAFVVSAFIGVMLNSVDRTTVRATDTETVSYDNTEMTLSPSLDLVAVLNDTVAIPVEDDKSEIIYDNVANDITIAQEGSAFVRKPPDKREIGDSS